MHIKYEAAPDIIDKLTRERGRLQKNLIKQQMSMNKFRLYLKLCAKFGVYHF